MRSLKTFPILIEQLVKVFVSIPQIKGSKIHFYIPFYHTGGAEQIHVDIIESAAIYNPIVFITERNKNSHFLKQLTIYATVINLSEIGKVTICWQYIKKLLTKITTQKTILFGANCNKFYKIASEIKKINSEVIAIDLIHAFSTPDWGVEQEAIHYVSLLDLRMTIAEYTKQQIIEQYQHHKISSSFNNNIQVIYNGVRMPKANNNTPKAKDAIHVFWVGRNSPEKRPHLAIQLANSLVDNDNFQFHFIGLSPNAFPTQSNSTFYGLLTSIQVAELYKQADVLLITSSREGLPLVLLEALGNGAIPIAANVGAISEIIVPDIGFLITSEADAFIQEATNSLRFILENSEWVKNAKELGSRLAAKYTIENMQQQYAEIWKKHLACNQ